ncbi:MAG: efflux RND transporter periplasmic adaptor subunit [Sphingomonas hengshuiensis]|uniref:Efflux RND transporter periplasmic adaptor subunit n=1 Tax=Sphingomonas hengshuiensis TaxID=1609977 RepID=A0A2W4ZE15_9SPHN|nr:MAG: efflux RND transporter periplasmic adaptor subunit [Sphingomonas hengshuiensis]
MHDDLPPVDGARAPRGLKAAGIAAALVAAGGVAIGVMARSHDGDVARRFSQDESVPAVRLVAVEQAPAGAELTLTGNTAAWETAHLYARVPGYVRAWYRDIGAQVPAGAALGVIDTPELDQSIARARADLASARAAMGLARDTAARWRDLLASDSVSKQEAAEKAGDLAVKQAAVEAAAAELGRLAAQKRFATIRAPFAGTITQRTADVGDLVGPGAVQPQPLFTMVDAERMRVYVAVPQSYSAAMRAGLNATLAVPEYPGRTFAARVQGTADAIVGASGTMQVQLVAGNGAHALKPGGYARITFHLPGVGGIRIPASAAMFHDKGLMVATVDAAHHVHMHPVTVAQDDGKTLTLATGVTAGERIIDNPPDSLSDGQLVRIAGGRA